MPLYIILYFDGSGNIRHEVTTETSIDPESVQPGENAYLFAVIDEAGKHDHGVEQ